MDVGLRRQILGLEEADIITSGEKVKDKGKESQDLSSIGRSAGTDKSLDGGMGKLDIGFLNSRSTVVSRDMEAELWQKVRLFLDKLSGGTNGQQVNGRESKDENEDEDMVF